jgi:hypothetical protein
MAPLWITTFIAVGVLFGLVTFRVRHLFSEGPTTPDDAAGLADRLMWVALSAALWPLFVVSGVYGTWRRRQRMARMAR